MIRNQWNIFSCWWRYSSYALLCIMSFYAWCSFFLCFWMGYLYQPKKYYKLSWVEFIGVLRHMQLYFSYMWRHRCAGWLKKKLNDSFNLTIWPRLDLLVFLIYNKSPKGHWSLTWVQWALLLKVRFLGKSESMTAMFKKSVWTAHNRDISIQDTRMHSVCCCCIPIWRRSPLEKSPLIDLILRQLSCMHPESM